MENRNRDFALTFARLSAMEAFDCWREYGSVADSVAAHRQNVRDTLAEYGATCHLARALAQFDLMVDCGRALC